LFLGAHPGYYDGEAKYERMKAGALENPFIDPQGYREFIDQAEKQFEEKLAASSPAH
jgi:metallo-beta-lactamase class B